MAEPTIFVATMLELERSALPGAELSTRLQRCLSLARQTADPALWERLIRLMSGSGLAALRWPDAESVRERLLLSSEDFELVTGFGEDLPVLRWADGRVLRGRVSACLEPRASTLWTALRDVALSPEERADLTLALDAPNPDRALQLRLIDILIDCEPSRFDEHLSQATGWVVDREPTAGGQGWQRATTAGSRALRVLRPVIRANGVTLRPGQFQFAPGEEETAAVKRWRACVPESGWLSPVVQDLELWLDDPCRADEGVARALARARAETLSILELRAGHAGARGLPEVQELDRELAPIRLLPGLEDAIPALVAAEQPANTRLVAWSGQAEGYARTVRSRDGALQVETWASRGWSPETRARLSLDAAMGERPTPPIAPEALSEEAQRREQLQARARGFWRRIAAESQPSPALIGLAAGLVGLEEELAAAGIRLMEPEQERVIFAADLGPAGPPPGEVVLPSLDTGDQEPPLPGVRWRILAEEEPARQHLRALLGPESSAWRALRAPTRWLADAVDPAWPSGAAIEAVRAAIRVRVEVPAGARPIELSRATLERLLASARTLAKAPRPGPLAALGAEEIPIAELAPAQLEVWLTPEAGPDELRWELPSLRFPSGEASPGVAHLLIRGLGDALPLLQAARRQPGLETRLSGLVEQLALDLPSPREASAELALRLARVRPLTLPARHELVVPEALLAQAQGWFPGLDRLLDEIGTPDPEAEEQRVTLLSVDPPYEMAPGTRLPGGLRLPRVLGVPGDAPRDQRHRALLQLVIALDRAAESLRPLRERCFPDDRVQAGWARACVSRLEELQASAATLAAALSPRSADLSLPTPLPGPAALHTAGLDLLRMSALWWGMFPDDEATPLFRRASAEIADDLVALGRLGPQPGLQGWPADDEAEWGLARAELQSVVDGASSTLDRRPRDPYVSVAGTPWFAIDTATGTHPEVRFHLPRTGELPLVGAMAVPNDQDVEYTRRKFLSMPRIAEADQRVALNLRHVLCKRLQLPPQERRRGRLQQLIEMVNVVWLNHGSFELMRQELQSVLSRVGVRVVGDITPAQVNELRARNQIDIVNRRIEVAYHARTVGGGGWLLVSRPRCEQAKDGELMQRMEVWMDR